MPGKKSYQERLRELLAGMGEDEAVARAIGGVVWMRGQLKRELTRRGLGAARPQSLFAWAERATGTKAEAVEAGRRRQEEAHRRKLAIRAEEIHAQRVEAARKGNEARQRKARERREKIAAEQAKRDKARKGST